MKKLTWIISAILILIVVAFAFIYISPDYGMYLVKSESMKGTINMGDLIITGPAGDIKPGTIVTYQRTIGLVTHRVLSVNGAILTTKGDAVEDPDPWTVPVSDVKGTLLFRIPYVGFASAFIQTRTGWFIAIIVPAAILVAWLVKDILKEAFKDGQKQQVDKGR